MGLILTLKKVTFYGNNNGDDDMDEVQRCLRYDHLSDIFTAPAIG